MNFALSTKQWTSLLLVISSLVAPPLVPPHSPAIPIGSLTCPTFECPACNCTCPAVDQFSYVSWAQVVVSILQLIFFLAVRLRGGRGDASGAPVRPPRRRVVAPLAIQNQAAELSDPPPSASRGSESSAPGSSVRGKGKGNGVRV